MADVRSTTPDDATVQLVATLGVPVDAAYRAFVDEMEQSRWYWPARFETSCEINAEVGGAWRVRSEVVPMGVTAVFGEVVPDERLAMSWQWDDAEDVTRVEIDFAAQGAGSTVTVTHGDNPTVQARDDHRTGWTDCLTRLCAYRP